MLKKINTILLLVAFSVTVFSQVSEEHQRIALIKEKLSQLATTSPELEKVVDFNLSSTELPTFVRAIGKESKVNIGVETQLKTIKLSHNFSNAKVKDILVYLCKEHALKIDITGNIISLKRKEVKKEKKKVIPPRNIPIEYNSKEDLFSIDLKNDTLSVAFKKITDVTGKNLVFSPDLANAKLSGYIKNKPFESAIDKLSFANNLLVTKTKDNYYLFEKSEDFIATSSSKKSSSRNGSRSNPGRKSTKTKKRYTESGFYFKVLDSLNKTVEIDFENAAISEIIQEIGAELNINIFTSAPLTDIGSVTAKINNISYDDLLVKILEDTEYTFDKKNDVYVFGKRDVASLINSVVIPLMHRSIETMNESMGSNGNSYNGNSTTNSGSGFTNIITNNQNNTQSNLSNSQSSNNSNIRNLNTQNNQSFGNYQSKSEALVNILPKDIVENLEIKTDVELNSFIVTGDAQNIERFKTFIKKIDKPIPVILIEVMILEVNKYNNIDTGLDFGLADGEVNSTGTILSSTNLTLGSNGINKIISSINNFGSFNIGKVASGFYAEIVAMEKNGNLKVRSTPKLSTLNGHEASLSNGSTTYYVQTTTNIIGTESPITSETKNFIPIDANLAINIKPLVSGDGQITLGVNVIQSSFGDQSDPEAPPPISSKEFNSTIRVKDQEVILLGGLEENRKSDFATSGIPFLARIPIIKWLFSSRSKNSSKSKLSILIKPTIIR